MKKILLGCVMVAALASCSNDDTILERKSSDDSSIKFAVTTQGATRASDVYCNTNMPGEFKVYATAGGQTFINGDIIKNTASEGQAAVWENQSANRYWPDSTLDFFAQVNGDDYFSLNAGAPTFDNFIVNDDVASQTDLLYAVKTGQAKATTGTEVDLNFRHALSQVVFYAKNINPDIYVVVEGVSVCGVNNSGTYTFPTSSTDTNVEHGATPGTAISGGQGSWALGTTKGSYSVTLADSVPLVGATDAVAVSLTDNTNVNADSSHAGTAAAPGTNAFGDAMILMPQTLTAIQLSEGQGNIDEATAQGVYFKVKCKIYNVADASATGEDLSKNVLLWGDDKDIYIPVSGTWNEGMKYVYTLVFGDGNGGWDPDGPKPVLVPITFTVSVDEFIPVSSTSEEVKMQTNE